MKKTELINACLQKEKALETAIKSNAEADKSVGRLKRQCRAIRVIRQIVEANCEDEVKMTNETEDELTAIIEPSRSHQSVVVHEGDTLLELWQRYNEVPEVMKKINAQLEKNGWVIDGTTGAVIKA